MPPSSTATPMKPTCRFEASDTHLLYRTQIVEKSNLENGGLAGSMHLYLWVGGSYRKGNFGSESYRFLASKSFSVGDIGARVRLHLCFYIFSTDLKTCYCLTFVCWALGTCSIPYGNRLNGDGTSFFAISTGELRRGG